MGRVGDASKEAVIDPGTLNEEALEEGLAVVEASASWSPRVVSKLETLIRGDDELALFRVNPLRYAADRSLDEGESIDLFLNATKAGLFDMEWAIVCSSCGNVFRSFRKLEKVDPHFRCNLCSMENDASLDEFIQVMFTISERVRPIALHHPERLGVEQLLFEFRYSKDVRAQYEGMTLPELMKSLTVRLEYLDPGQELSFEVDLAGGELVCREVIGDSSLAFFEVEDMPPLAEPVTISIQEGLVAPSLKLSEFTLESPIGTFVFPAVHFVGPGTVSVTCVNESDVRRTFWATRYPPLEEFEPRDIELDPFLSAKQLLSSDTFHRLFRSEMPPEAEGLSVNDLTYLFTDLKGSTSMYDAIGDGTAYNLVRLHFEVLNRAVASNSGVIVKTIGDAIMATFVDPASAVSAALAMMEGLDEFNRTMSAELALKVGIHRGHSIAVNLNERLDYFGQNVNIAARTQQLAGQGEILLTDDVLDAPDVAGLVSGFDLEPVDGQMKGVVEDISVFRLVPAAAAG